MVSCASMIEEQMLILFGLVFMILKIRKSIVVKETQVENDLWKISD